MDQLKPEMEKAVATTVARRSGEMKRRREGRGRGVRGGGPNERAGLKRCRTLTNLNATCFKLCQSEREAATLETSCAIAPKPKWQAGTQTLSTDFFFILIFRGTHQGEDDGMMSSRWNSNLISRK